MYAGRSLLSFRRADWESSSGASDWFAGGMEVPELFLSTTVAWKHYASYPTKSFCCFVAVCPGLEHRPHFCRKTEELAWQRFSVFNFFSKIELTSSTPGLIRRQSFSDFLMRKTNVTNVT